MDRYVIEGVLADGQSGRFVLVVGETHHEVSAAFKSLLAAIEADQVEHRRVCRVHGCQGVRFDHGRVEFRSADSIRGYVPDVLVIDAASWELNWGTWDSPTATSEVIWWRRGVHE